MVTRRVKTGDSVKYAVPYAIATGNQHRKDVDTLLGGEPAAVCGEGPGSLAPNIIGAFF